MTLTCLCPLAKLSTNMNVIHNHNHGIADFLYSEFPHFRNQQIPNHFFKFFRSSSPNNSQPKLHGS